jgi:methionyl-tRNA formyltransferase
VRRRLFGLDDFRRRYFGEPSRLTIGKGTRILSVKWVNETRVATALAQAKPDITIVMGTSILNDKTLYAAGTTAINIHGGYLPDFRGNHCFFFAMLERRHDRIGSTIHFLDSDVDTGDIIEHVSVRAKSGECAEVLYCRAEKEAIHRLIELLHGLQNGQPLPRRAQGPGGRTYKMRDRKPWHDVMLWLRCRPPRAVPWLFANGRGR